MDIEQGAMTLAGKSCLIEVDEDYWLSLPDDRQVYCKEVWTEKARQQPDTARVVLRLIPDALFPMHGHDKPYIAWQADIDRPPECGFTVDTVVTITVNTDSKYVDPVMRADISGRLAGVRVQAVTYGATFRIVNARGDVIEHGRL